MNNSATVSMRQELKLNNEFKENLNAKQELNEKKINDHASYINLKRILSFQKLKKEKKKEE